MRASVVALILGVHLFTAAPGLANETGATTGAEQLYVALQSPCPTSSDGDPNFSADGFAEGIEVEGTESTSGSTDCDGGGDSDPWDYRFREKVCGSDSSYHYCAAVYCPNPEATGYLVDRRLEGSDDPWRSNGFRCVLPDQPTVTPVIVLDALRRVGLPKAELQTEPGFESGKTLVNFDTNFYTTVDPVTETFTLLGQQVTVEATPASYTWHFDSGRADQTRTTSTPGAPYPELDVTYAYDDAHVTVHPSVDVTYSARFSVNGNTWQTIPETVTIDGSPISRYVAEAEARLADMN